MPNEYFSCIALLNLDTELKKNVTGRAILKMEMIDKRMHKVSLNYLA